MLLVSWTSSNLVKGLYTHVSPKAHVIGDTYMYVLSFAVAKTMRELDFIASVLLILIHMSMGQSTTSLSKKYSQIGVTINSWNSEQFQATDFLGMGSMR